METMSHPTFGNGKICYILIPAVDIAVSAKFYKDVFGWNIRDDGDGNTSFDDGVGEVSGMWVLDREPSTEGGFVIHIMIDDMEASKILITANGGKLVVGSEMDGAEKFLLFIDVAGNVMGIYQHSR